MEEARPGGLSGKARHVRCRNRAARMQADELVNEYLESTMTSPGRRRTIPIRGRSEFLPSIAQAQAASAAGRDAQLELPLASTKEPGKVQPAAADTATVPKTASKPPVDVVIRFPRSSKPTAPLRLKPPTHYRRKSEFTIGGFLAGCAMGSAAAALLLLVVQTVFK